MKKERERERKKRTRRNEKKFDISNYHIVKGFQPEKPFLVSVTKILMYIAITIFIVRIARKYSYSRKYIFSNINYFILSMRF